MMFPMMKKNGQAYKTCECCREKQHKRYAAKKEEAAANEEWDKAVEEIKRFCEEADAKKKAKKKAKREAAKQGKVIEEEYSSSENYY
jgi:hypothetical protein